MRPILACVAALALFAPAGAVTLIGHHAVYTLALQSSEGGHVVAATGTMIFDVQDACTGWTTAQRLTLDVTDRDGQPDSSVSDYATFESKDGTKLEFHSKEISGRVVTQQLDGTATLDRSGGRGQALYSSPQKNTALLPVGTLLPMAHTSAILEAARTGRRFLSVPLFDGTGGDGAQDSFVTIEGWDKPAPGRWPALAALASTRVHIAFFDRGHDSVTPDYEIGMRYYTNGVADQMSMNFGDFVMAGTLDRFEPRPPPRC